MISCEETDVSSGLQVVAKLYGEASVKGGGPMKIKRDGADEEHDAFLPIIVIVDTRLATGG